MDADREEALRAIYDQDYVDQYDPHAAWRMRRLLPFIALSGHEVVADFACGNGVLLEILSPLVRTYVGVDFSDAFVRAAKRRRDEHRLTNGTFHCADIVSFCAERPKAFDAGFALDFSEHIDDEQFLRIFRAIHDALKPRAPLYLHTPNREYFMECFRRWGVLREIEGHVAIRDARTHQMLLAQCGFTDVDVRYLPHYLRLASRFHWLGAVPVIGKYFRARLFVTCRA